MKGFWSGALIGLLVGLALAFVALGWTVLAANGVRDLAILGMQQQAERCAAPVAPKPLAQKQPRRWKL